MIWVSVAMSGYNPKAFEHCSSRAASAPRSSSRSCDLTAAACCVQIGMNELLLDVAHCFFIPL
jgi:hypothetical protein